IVNAPQPGMALGARLATDPSVRRVGVLELDDLPSGSYDDLTTAAPSCEFVDATRVFAEVRRGADPAEVALLARADAIAVAALHHVEETNVSDAGALAGAVEKHARLAGAEEAYIAVAPDLAADRRMIRATPALTLGDLFAVRASIAYKGHWVRRTRTFAANTAARDVIRRADAWFANLIASLAAGTPLAQHIAARVQEL